MLIIFLLFLSIKSQIIIVKLQGVRFETTRETLQKIPYINNMLSDQYNRYLIDRSPTGFGHVLSWAVDPRYPFPSKFKYELDYYGINHNEVNMIDDVCYS